MSTKIGLFILVVFTLVACKNKGEKSFEALMSKGIALVEGDTILAKTGDLLLYSYGFSAGVEPIHYTLAYNISHPSTVEYVENQEFYVGDEDMAGGPMKGVHVLEAKQKGICKIEFYNDYYNQEKHGLELKGISPFDIMEEFYTSYQVPKDTSTNSKQISAAKEKWLASFEASIAPQIDSILKVHARKYAFGTPIVLDALIELYNEAPFSHGNQLTETMEMIRNNAPIHPEIASTIFYVSIR